MPSRHLSDREVRDQSWCLHSSRRHHLRVLPVVGCIGACLLDHRVTCYSHTKRYHIGSRCWTWLAIETPGSCFALSDACRRTSQLYLARKLTAAQVAQQCPIDLKWSN